MDSTTPLYMIVIFLLCLNSCLLVSLRNAVTLPNKERTVGQEAKLQGKIHTVPIFNLMGLHDPDKVQKLPAAALEGRRMAPSKFRLQNGAMFYPLRVSVVC